MFENHKKVALNNASKASYVYILSGQKLIKNAKKVYFGEFLKTWSYGQPLLPDRSVLVGQKLVENAKIQILTEE